LAHAINSGSLYEDFLENPAQVQKRILDIAIQFARGLHYAHESRDESGKPQNLIHRDVKPGNVLLSKSGEVKVSDFGLTKSVTRPPQGAPAGDAEASCFKGTLAYCSMEQMDEKPLTQRTDLYSWAVSVMELYVGGHPWTNGVVAGLNCQQYFSEAQIPIPAPMVDLLERCLASEPDDRPHDFGLVIAELRAIYRMETGEDYPREASKAAADTADSLNNRALSMLDIGKPEEAEKLWEKGLLTNPNHSDLVFNRLLFQLRNNRISASNALRIMRMDFENHFGNSHSSSLCSMIAYEGGDLYSVKGYASRSDEPEAVALLSAIETGIAYTCRSILSKITNYGESMHLQARYEEMEQTIQSLIRADRLEEAMRLMTTAVYDPDLQGFAFSPERVQLSEELRKYGFLFYVASVWHVRTLSSRLAEGICFTPDGDKLLLHNTLYQVATNDVIRVYENCGEVCSRISPDGKAFLASNHSDEFSVIDVLSGEMQKKVRTFRSDITHMVWSADGTRILIGEEDGRIMLFDSKTMEGVISIDLEDGPIRKLNIKYDGSEAFVLSDTMLNHIRFAPLEVVKRYQSTTKVYDFCVNLHYDTLAFAYGYYGLYTVDLETGKQTHHT
ncbi:MAG: protein kinase family protein, partial [Clostridiaceae bacterium]